MKTSLVSREVIADSIELVARGHLFDAIVCISGCDKTIPATVMAMARLDIPGVMLYGGSIHPGRYQGEDITIQEVFEAVGKHATGAITDEELTAIEQAASPGAGACGGQFTANTMAMAFEVLGISAMGSSMVPAEDGRKAEVAKETGHLVVDVLSAACCPARSSAGRRSRTRSPRWRPAAGRPTPCCTCSRSPARPACSSTSTTSTASRRARR
jgi:dihydroxy-acid dehydratase